MVSQNITLETHNPNHIVLEDVLFQLQYMVIITTHKFLN